MADYTIQQGDTGPPFIYTPLYADGTPPDLTSATATLTRRSLANATAETTTGSVAVAGGTLVYTPASGDTASPGNFMATFRVTLAGGSIVTFPPQGYLWLAVEPNLATAPQQVVSLPELKQHCGVRAEDRTRDGRLIDLVNAITALAELEVGPLLPRLIEEWHDGGSETIHLTHAPSSALGTTPILQLVAVSEYVGSTEYPLALVASPVYGSIYSAFVNPELGSITRRGPGGSTLPFSPGTDNVHVIYRAGQQVIPANVREGILEACRVNYQTTQQVGKGRRTVSDEQDIGPAMGYFLPRRCVELLRPTKRHPSLS